MMPRQRLLLPLLLLLLLLLPVLIHSLSCFMPPLPAARRAWPSWRAGMTGRQLQLRAACGASRSLPARRSLALAASPAVGGAGDDGGGGREGIAAHERAMTGFHIEDAILHQDEDVVVMNKPPNALCVPGRYIKDSLVVRVAEHLNVKDYARMVVHRLDQHTSGVVVFAKHERALKHLHAQLRDKAAAGGMEKGYVALVARGPLDPLEGRITLPLRKDMDNPPKQMVDMAAGKPCLTRYRVRRASPARCLVGLEPVTGRTHQLRVHLGAVGHPILGDGFYAPHAIRELSPDRLCLHAETISFLHPTTGQRVSFSCPYPPDWDLGPWGGE